MFPVSSIMLNSFTYIGKRRGQDILIDSLIISSVPGHLPLLPLDTTHDFTFCNFNIKCTRIKVWNSQDILCFFSVLYLLCLCARLFICAVWSPAGKRLTSLPLGSRLWYLTVSLSLSHWYPESGVVLDCIDS